MNILILTTHFNTGGITSYILTLAKGLREKNHNVHVATSGGNMVEALSAFGCEHHTFNIKTKSELSPKLYFALGSILKLIKEKNIDVIHTHTRTTQVMGTLLSRKSVRAHVSTCHGFFKKRLSRRIFPCWGKAVIAISEAVRAHLIADFGVDEKKVFLIHNGIDLSAFSPVSEELRSQKRKEFNLKGGPVIGIIARLSDVKGHAILIGAMKQIVGKIPQASLLIVGEGKLEKDLKRQIKALGLENHILFYPIVNQTASMLSLLDVFVMPSLQEGLGLSVMEAQAMGLAVVASRVGGIPSLIEDGKTGLLVYPKDIDGLARAVVDLLTDKVKAKKIGQAARRFIESRFSADKMVQETIDCYSQVITKN